jgi:hypothetical protein
MTSFAIQQLRFKQSSSFNPEGKNIYIAREKKNKNKNKGKIHKIQNLDFIPSLTTNKGELENLR